MADTIIDLGRKVKAKYPDYADMSDEEVGRKVKAKFPGEYDDFIDISSKPGTLERVEKAADLPSLAPASDWPSMGPQFRQQLKDLYYGVAGIVPQTNAALQRTGQAMLRGDPLGTVREAPGIVPVIGPQTQQIGQDVEQGNYPEAGGHFIRLGTQLLAPRAISRGPAAMEAGAVRAQQGGAIAGGAARGAWEESMAPGMIKIAKLPIEIPGPKIVSNTVTGAGLGRFAIGGNEGALIGGAAGATYPIVKGAIQGGRKANQAFKAKNIPAPPQPPATLTPPPAGLLEQGSIQMPPPEDTSFVRAVPAEYPAKEGMPPKPELTPAPGAPGGEPLVPLKPEHQAVVDRVLANSSVIQHPEGMPSDYIEMIKKWGVDQAEKAHQKDLAIAQRVAADPNMTIEKWDALDLDGKSAYAKAVGRKAFDKGGANSRGADLGTTHVRNRLLEIWGLKPPD